MGLPASPTATASGRITKNSKGTNHQVTSDQSTAHSIAPSNTTAATSPMRSMRSVDPSMACTRNAGACAGWVAMWSASTGGSGVARACSTTSSACGVGTSRACRLASVSWRSTRRSATPAANTARKPYVVKASATP
jgi:hypothetical protein